MLRNNWDRGLPRSSWPLKCGFTGYRRMRVGSIKSRSSSARYNGTSSLRTISPVRWPWRSSSRPILLSSISTRSRFSGHTRKQNCSRNSGRRNQRNSLRNSCGLYLVDACCTKYPNGLVTNVQKGQVPSQYQSVARYVAKYVVSPPIAVRRIDRYDGQRVTYHYRSHRTERVEHETVAVDTFIGRMVQHSMPKGFKRIRYYGVQATKTFVTVKGVIRAALAKVEGVVRGAVKIIARLTYRQRYEQSTGRDPFICPHCGHEMG